MRKLLGLAALVIVYGSCFLLDVRPTRHGSWPSYVALALGGGVLLLTLEFVAESIGGSDKTTDPLHSRLLKLLGLLLLGLVGCTAVWSIVQLM